MFTPESHIWQDVEGAIPARELANLLKDLGVKGPIGYESDTVGLTDRTGRALHAAIPGPTDASELIRACRRVKSPAEIEMHRRAAALSDDALDQADHHRRMHAAAVEALEACEKAIRPGAPMGEVHDGTPFPPLA